MRIATPPLYVDNSVAAEAPQHQTPFAPEPEIIAGSCMLGICIRKDKTLLVLAHRRNSVFARREIRTSPDRGVDAFLQELDAFYEEFGKSNLSCVSIAADGPVDVEHGALLFPAAVPGWTNLPFTHRIAQLFKVPVFMMSCACAGAYAEWRYGAGRSEYVRKLIFLSSTQHPQFGIVCDGFLMNIPGTLNESGGPQVLGSDSKALERAKESRQKQNWTLFPLYDLVPELREDDVETEAAEAMPLDELIEATARHCSWLINSFAPDMIIVDSETPLDEERLRSVRHSVAQQCSSRLAERCVITRPSLGVRLAETMATAAGLWNGLPRGEDAPASLQSQLVDLGRLISELMANRLFLRNIQAASNKILDVFQSGGRLLVCGNGASGTSARHFVDHLSGFYHAARPSLPAFNLCESASLITSIYDQFGYETIYSRQLQGLGRAGDLLVVFSDGTECMSITRAISAAKVLGMQTLLITGRSMSNGKPDADLEINIPTDSAERVQEMHVVVLHALCEIIEAQMAS